MKIICIGRNYAAHATEMKAERLSELQNKRAQWIFADSLRLLMARAQAGVPTGAGLMKRAKQRQAAKKQDPFYFPAGSWAFVLLLLLAACESAPSSDSEDSATLASMAQDENPAAEGFDLSGSDSLAIAIADEVVKAHGGRKAYDQNRYFQWNFFGVRSLTWDKEEKRVRIDFPARSAVYLLNYQQETGRVQVAGEEISQPDSLAKYLAEARSIWINDSYWLVHQFKLKDSGVTLKMAEDSPADPQRQRPSYVLDQTFKAVGDTPNNRYRLYIDKEDYRINTWQFFRDAGDAEASISTPWEGYQTYNGLLISTDRSGRFQLQDVKTPLDLADSLFTDF